MEKNTLIVVVAALIIMAVASVMHTVAYICFIGLWCWGLMKCCDGITNNIIKKMHNESYADLQKRMAKTT